MKLNKKMITLLVLTTLLMSMMPMIPMASASTIYYVDDDTGANTANGSTETLAFKTITYALTKVVTGDTIIVLPGTYNLALGETFPLTINTAGITIKSKAGATTTNVIPTNTDGSAFKVTAAGVTIGGIDSGFTIGSGGGAGIVADETGGKGIIVQGNLFKSYSSGESRGMWFEKLWYGALITDNSFTTPKVGTGIIVVNADGATISNNLAPTETIKYCFLTFKAELAYWDGSQWYEHVATTASYINDILVTGNEITGITQAGYPAIRIATSTKNWPLAGLAAQDLTIGLDRITITANLFAGNPIDIKIDGDTEAFVSKDPDVPYDPPQIAHINGAENIRINYNDLLGTVGVKNDVTSATVNAEFNWWGATTAPLVTSDWVGLVDYTPWLGAPIGSGVAGFSIDYVTPGTVTYDQELTIRGSGVTAGSNVKLYWDYILAANLLNTTVGKPSGIFECTIDVPSDIAGSHYLWAKDENTGLSTKFGPITMVPILKVSPTSGLPGDTITLKGYGFAKEAVITSIYDDFVGSAGALEATEAPAQPKATTLGYWTATFVIPATTTYASEYHITALYAGVSTVANLKVGSSITLSKKSGPVGTVVEISGSGFTKSGATIIAGGVMIDGKAAAITNLPVTIKTDGTFKATIVIPQTAAKAKYPIIVTKDAAAGAVLTASANFEVTGLAEVKATPSYGPQGSTVTVEGWNFTQIANTDVTVKLETLGAKTFKTDSRGHFVGTYIVPAVSSGSHVGGLKAEQTVYGISATNDFRAGVMVVILSPNPVPAGAAGRLTGTGFTSGGAWNATFGSITWVADGTLPSATEISASPLYVPSVAPGVYTVSIWDEVAKIEVLVPFTVTAATKASTNPAVAPQDYNVTISGNYFAQKEHAVLDFVIFNATDSWDMDVYVGGPTSTTKETVDKDGNFTGWWNFNQKNSTSKHRILQD